MGRVGENGRGGEWERFSKRGRQKTGEGKMEKGKRREIGQMREGVTIRRKEGVTWRISV